MNKIRICLFILCLIFILGWRNNPPDLRTGATSNSTCASSNCHTPGTTNIEGTLTLEGLPQDITPGETYDLRVVIKMTAGDAEKAGFQMVSLDADKKGIGTFQTTNNEVTQSEANGIQHVDHAEAKLFSGNSVEYGMKWTAPDEASPDVWTFYAVAILADGNNSKSGDKFQSITVSRSVGTLQDADNDGFKNDEDCDDNNPDINPNAEEILNNDIDENCDGLIEVIDVDQDGFHSDEDCDDNNADINPDADEVPNNDIDEDCDGEKQIIDLDNDGFNSDEDCDDTNGAVHPNASEIPNNDVDENCDGEVLIIDNDEDGFNSDEDCDDQNPLINPDAEEVLGDGKDNDCDGEVDECICTADFDPVCGSDGMTYSNSCQAECAGINDYTQGMCPEPSEGISGKVTISDSVGLSNVMISLSDGREVLVSEDGSFFIDSLGTDTTLTLTFSRNDNHANGVSAIDLVQIINHILAKPTFEDELKILAADADGNGSVSALDLVHIRNVLLGIWTEFSSNDSWGFLPKSINASQLNSDEILSIRAYKIGDVNGSADPN